MPSTRSQTRTQVQPRITEQSTTTVDPTPTTKKSRTPRTAGRTRTPSRPNYVAVTVAVSAPYEDMNEEEDEEEEFESWNTDRYKVMEQPVKSYCLDMIAHCQANEKAIEGYWGLRGLLDETRIFARYRNWDAQYDDCFFRIPLDEWIEQTGLTREQTEAVGNCFSPYMGSIHFHEFSRKGRPLVTIYGDS